MAMGIPVPVIGIFEHLVVGRIGAHEIWLHVDDVEAPRFCFRNQPRPHLPEIARLHRSEIGWIIELQTRRIDRQHDVARLEARSLRKRG